MFSGDAMAEQRGSGEVARAETDCSNQDNPSIVCCKTGNLGVACDDCHCRWAGVAEAADHGRVRGGGAGGSGRD